MTSHPAAGADFRHAKGQNTLTLLSSNSLDRRRLAADCRFTGSSRNAPLK